MKANKKYLELASLKELAREKPYLMAAILIVLILGIVPYFYFSPAYGNETILVNLKYKQETKYDINDDGIENLTGIIDFTVEDTEFIWEVNLSKVSTKWEIHSLDDNLTTTICYGAESSCSFVELENIMPNWDDTFYLYYGRYGATFNNTVSAQVIYVDYSLDVENPYSEIYSSEWQSLPAVFVGESMINLSVNVSFVNETLNASENITNNMPILIKNVSNITINKNENYTMDLSEYFYDEDDDELVYDYYKTDNITVLIEGSTAAIIPDEDFTGTRYSFFKANDSELTAVSNVFKIEVIGILNISEESIQLPAEINKPVKWIKKSENNIVEIPEEAFNLSISRVINDEKISIEKNKIKQKERLKSLGARTLTEEISNKKEIIINESADYFEITYETEAPNKKETELKGSRKRILVYSNVSMHYQDVKAFTDITESGVKLRLYHIINGSYIDVTDNGKYNVTFLDTNNNGLHDKIEWVVPELSEQLFEIGLAAINTKKSIYHPGETAEIIMVVLDNEGHLVSNANVVLNITPPDDVVYSYSTLDNEIIETERGIYEISFSDTNLEGNYSMFVSAIGENVNSTMLSYFIVREYYEFDILRQTPVTTDPWKGAFTSSIRIISHTNSSIFNFSEVLPINFEIINNGDSIIKIENNKKILTWQNLANNSVVSYSALPPKVTPELYELQSYINYNSETFTEARPWYLAVDPPAQSGAYLILFWDGGAAPDGWTIISDDADEPFYEKFPRGADSYGGTSGAETHTHTVTQVGDSSTSTASSSARTGSNGATATHYHSAPLSSGSTNETSLLPLYRDLKVIVYNTGIPSTIPEGAIAIFNSSSPSGWTDYTDQNDKFVRGAATVGGTGGEANGHTHTVSIATGIENTAAQSATAAGTGYCAYAHNHSGSGTADSQNQWPPYIKVVLAKADSNTSIPWGMIGMFNATPPAIQWDIASDSGEDFYQRFLFGNTSTSFPATGGSATHQHGNLVITTGGPNQQRSQGSSTSRTVASSTHVHTVNVSFNEGSNLPPYRDVIIAYALDLIPPTIALNDPANNSFSNNITNAFNFTPSDSNDIANCTLIINGTYNQTNTSTIVKDQENTITINLTEGKWLWTVNCTDVYGNEGTNASVRTLTVDTTYPAINFAGGTENNNTYFNRNWIYVNVSITDANKNETRFYLYNSSFDLINNTNYTDGTTYINFTNLADTNEIYYYNVTHRDKANNENSTETRKITLDTTNPSIDFAGGTEANNTYFNRNWIYVNVSITDANKNETRFYLYNSSFDLINNTNYTDGTTYINFTNLADTNEIYYYNVTHRDKANNENSTETRRITLDSTYPTVNLNAPVNDHNSSISWVLFNFTATDNIATTLNCSVYIDGVLNNTNSSTNNGTATLFNITGIVDGSHSWNVSCADNATNVNWSETRNFTIDATEPSIVLNFPVNDYNSSNTSINFNWTATDNVYTNLTCNLTIDGVVNVSDISALNGTPANYTVNNFDEGYHYWNVSCWDYLYNTNWSETRNFTVDTTPPSISNENVNETTLLVHRPICLNVTVTDNFAVDTVMAEYNIPTVGLTNITMSDSQTTSCDPVNGDGVYSAVFVCDYVGNYTWNRTYATDAAGNMNITSPLIPWPVTAAAAAVTLMGPTEDLEINESGANNWYEHMCNATCDPSGDEDCENVTLFAQYNPGTWTHITTSTTDLVNDEDNATAPSPLLRGNSYSHIFNITAGSNSGGNAWPIRCKAFTTNAGDADSTTVTLTVNDHPVANWTYPTNGTWLHSTEILNASASTDDQGISNYVFELDNNTLFDSSTILCNSADPNCTLNTLTQTQCNNESFECYLRLNVTDNDGLQNSTYITIGIDNTAPTSTLDRPQNGTNITTSTYVLNATVIDYGSGVNVTTFLYRENPTVNWKSACNDTDGSAPFECTWDLSSLSDGNYYQIRVYANDSEGNIGNNDTHYNITVDKTPPTINLELPLNDTWSLNDVTFYYNVSDVTSDVANCSLIIDNKINQTNSTITEDTSLNFIVYNISDGNRNWNVNCTDVLGNENSSEIRLIKIDNTGPTATLDRPQNFTNISASSYMINASVSDNGIGVNVTSFYYRENDGASWNLICNDSTEPYSYNWNTGSLTEGNYYQIRVYANDSLGNIGLNDTHSNITIDRTPPAVYLESPANNSQDIDGIITFEYNASDALLGIVNCSLIINGIINLTDTTISESVTQSFQQNLSNGTYTWNVNCTDSADNINSSSVYFLNVSPDTTPPIIILLSPAHNSTYTKRDVIFQYNVTDKLSGIANCSLIFDNKLNQTTQSPAEQQTNTFTINNVADGNYSWSVNCTDDSTALNTGNSSTWNFTLLETTTILVNVSTDKTGYERGEIAYITTNTTDKFYNKLETNVTTDIILGNTTWPWWNTSWKRRSTILLNETAGVNRTNITIRVNVTGINGYISNCTNEIRIVTNISSTNRLIESEIVDGDNSTYCTVIFKGDVSANAVNEKNYYVYYNNSQAADPGFDIDTINTTYNRTSYNGILTTTGTVNNGSYGISKVNTQNCAQGTCDDTNSWRAGFDDASPANTQIDWYFNVSHLGIAGSDIVNITVTGGGCWAGDGGAVAASCDGSDDAEFAAATSPQLFFFIYNGNGYGAIGTGYEITPGGNTGAGPGANYRVYNKSKTSGFVDGHINGSGIIKIRYNVTGTTLGTSYDVIGVYDFAFLTITYEKIYGNISSIKTAVVWVTSYSNETGTDGGWTFSWDTFNQSYGNYSAVSLASNPNYNNGTGYAWFEIIPDTTAPAINLTSPLNSSWDNIGNITFIYLPFDNSHHFSNCSLILNNKLNQTNSTAIIDNAQNNFTLNNLNEGYYNWSINCTDYAGNENNSETRRLTIDKIAPTWSGNKTNRTKPNNGDTVQFNITWGDTYSLDSYKFSWNDTGSWVNVSNVSISGTSYIAVENQTVTATAETVVSYKWYANDSAGNWNETPIWQFTVNSGPAINSTNATPEIQGYGLNVTIQANVTDIDGISSVYVEITDPNNKAANYSMTNVSSIYYYNYSNWLNGSYSYKIYANDIWGAMTNSSTYYFYLQVNLTVQVRTLKDVYGADEVVNLTDPPEFVLPLRDVPVQMDDVESSELSDDKDELDLGGLSEEDSPTITNAYVEPTDVKPRDKMSVSADIKDSGKTIMKFSKNETSILLSTTPTYYQNEDKLLDLNKNPFDIIPSVSATENGLTKETKTSWSLKILNFVNDIFENKINVSFIDMTPSIVSWVFYSNDSRLIAVSDVFKINISEIEEKELEQLKVEINKPVKWIKKSENNIVEIPDSAFNVSIKKIINNEKIEIDKTKIKIKDKEIIINETADSYEIIYETKAPKSIEEKINDYNKKIKIVSEINYTGVLAYTDITESPKEAIKLYWYKDGVKTDVTNAQEINLKFIDSNANNLIERLEWTVPHLSNQTFEVSITILNVQSYPTVGGKWTVMFNTTGTANLTITSVKETTWSNINEDNDLKFLEIICGDSTKEYAWIGNSVFIQNYNCNETGYELSKVLTPGRHTLQFKFGDDVKYAFNIAGWWNEGWQYRKQLNITNNNDSTILEAGYSVNFTTDTTGTKFLDNGNDVRIVYYNGTNYELDRINKTAFNSATTQILFKLQANISAGGWNASYYMYYGNSTAGSPPTNKSKVYAFYDDFSGDLSKWTKHVTSGVYPQIESGYLSCGGGSTTSPYGHTVLGSNASYTGFTNGIIEGKLYLATAAIAEIGFRGDKAGNTGYKSRADARTSEGLSHLMPPYSGWNFLTGCTQSGTAVGTGAWKDFKITVLGSSFTIKTDGQTKTCSDATYTSAGEISLQNHYGSYSNYDDISVRKYLEPEPSIVVGEEETSADTTAPTYTGNGTNTTSPKNRETILIYANWTDGTMLNYTWSGNNFTGTWSNETPVARAGLTSINHTNATVITIGDAEVGCYILYANDTSGNVNQTTMSCITVRNVAPTYTNVVKNDSKIYQYEWVQFNTTWQDNIALNYSVFSTNLSGSWVNATSQSFNPANNISTNVSYIDATSGTKVGWRFYANDTSGNINQTTIQEFLVGGVIWNQTSLDLGSTAQNSADLTSNVILTGYLNNTNVNVTCYEGDCSIITANFTTTDLNDTTVAVAFNCSTSTVGSFEANFSVNSSEDIYSYNISVDCSITIVDTTAPTYTNVVKNDSKIYQYEWVQFNTTWQDNIALNYSVFSTNLSGSWVNATSQSFNPANNISTNVSYIDATSGTKVGWRFYANDTSGNINQTTIQEFLVGGVIWNQTSLDLGSANQNDAALSSNVLLIGYLNNTNVNVTCYEGDCSVITANFTTMDLNDTTVTVAFNCSTATGGSFMAKFPVNSTEDVYLHNISVDCSISGITYTKFRRKGKTKNLDSVGSDNENVSLILDDAVHARIKWKENVTINDSYNLDNAVDYSYATVFVNASMYPSLNVSANITMKNLQMGYPKILKDGVECSDCVILSWDTNTGGLTFNVSSFSTYTASEANQSKIQNNGTTNTSFYLLLQVHKWNGSSWNESWNVYNSTASMRINNTAADGNLIKLDAYFNGKWNTTANGTGDGYYRVYAALLDNSSNVLKKYDGSNLTAAYNFTVDTTEPSIILNLPVDDYNTSTNSINFNWTATDNLDTSLLCNLTIDGIVNVSSISSANGTPTNYTITGIPDGIHYWNVTCWDNAFNANTSLTRSFTVDTTEPSIILNLPVDDYNTSSNSINFNWTATDNIYTDLTCNLTIDGVVNVSNINATNGTATNYTVNNFDDGYHYWNISCWDYLYNTNWSETRNFTIDTTGPTIVLNFPVNDYNTSNTSINFNWTATDNIYINLTCNLTIDGVVNVSGINATNGTAINYTINNFDEGYHYWNVSCWDYLNNINSSETRNFTVVKGPDELNASLNDDNVSIDLEWSAKSYADSYSIYITDNYAIGFPSTANVTGITDANWTDTNAEQSTRRFYRVATVKGTINATGIKTVGKYETELTKRTDQINDWNLVSIPFNLTRWELDNGTNSGYDPPVQPANCIRSLYRYNVTAGWERTDYNGSEWRPAADDENFTALEAGRGYWFEVNSSCNLTFVGEVPVNNMSISLDQGWNLVGWYSTNSSNLPITSEAIGWAQPEPPYYPIDVDPAGTVKSIDRYNTNTGEFEVTIHYDSNWGWWPSYNNQDFTTIDPTKGYYFDTNPAAVWMHDPNT